MGGSCDRNLWVRHWVKNSQNVQMVEVQIWWGIPRFSYYLHLRWLEGPCAGLKSRLDHQNNLEKVDQSIWFEDQHSAKLSSKKHVFGTFICSLRTFCPPPSHPISPGSLCPTFHPPLLRLLFCWRKNSSVPPSWCIALHLSRHMPCNSRYFIRKKCEKATNAQCSMDGNGFVCYLFQVM